MPECMFPAICSTPIAAIDAGPNAIAPEKPAPRTPDPIARAALYPPYIPAKFNPTLANPAELLIPPIAILPA